MARSLPLGGCGSPADRRGGGLELDVRRMSPDLPPLVAPARLLIREVGARVKSETCVVSLLRLAATAHLLRSEVRDRV